MRTGVRTTAALLGLACLGTALVTGCAPARRGVAPGAEAPIPHRDLQVETAPGVRLHVQIVGRGVDTLVMLHGGPALDAEYLIPDLEPLHRRFVVVYYDQRGNGRSTLAPPGPEAGAWLHVDRHAEDLDALRRHFGMTRMTVIGNSWGAMLAARYIVRYGNSISRLIFHAPGPPTMALLQSSSELLRARIAPDAAARQNLAWQTWQQGGGPDVVATCAAYNAAIASVYVADASHLSRYRGRDCVAPEAALRDYPRAARLILASLGRFDFRHAARTFSSPVLIVVGDRDWIVPESTEMWADAFPDAQVVRIPNAGHLVHAEQPRAYLEALTAFLARTR